MLWTQHRGDIKVVNDDTLYEDDVATNGDTTFEIYSERKSFIVSFCCYFKDLFFLIFFYKKIDFCVIYSDYGFPPPKSSPPALPSESTPFPCLLSEKK